MAGRLKNLGANPHHIQHAPRQSPLSTMRKVSQRPALITSTSRALAHKRNPSLVHASIQQLPPIRVPKVQSNPATIDSSLEKLPRIAKPHSKLRADLLPNRIAASPDTRPDSRQQILHPRSILLRHLGNSPLDDPRHRPSPPRMKRPHHPLLHIDHQHRNTIRSPHSQQYPRHIGDQSIPLQHCLPLRRLQPPLQRPIPLPNHVHDPRVNLSYSHQRKTIVRITNSRQKLTSILRHQSRVILLRPPQIQGMTSVSRRNPAPPCAEPVSQPPVPLQSLHLHNFQSAMSANLFILNTQNRILHLALT
jgi:hypothetical protein